MSNPRTIKNILTTEEKNAYNQSFSGIGYNCNYNYVIMEIFFLLQSWKSYNHELLSFGTENLG